MTEKITRQRPVFIGLRRHTPASLAKHEENRKVRRAVKLATATLFAAAATVMGLTAILTRGEVDEDDLMEPETSEGGDD